jgi:signal peptidase II
MWPIVATFSAYDHPTREQMLRLNRILQMLLTLGLVAFDLLAKTWAQSAIATTQGPTDIFPFLSLVLAYNPGITFGGLLGLSQHPFLSMLISASIIAALLAWLWKEIGLLRGFFIVFALSGALGNTIDRIKNGMVTDFLQFHVSDSSLIVVNLADLWVIIGFIGLAITGWPTPTRGAGSKKKGLPIRDQKSEQS